MTQPTGSIMQIAYVVSDMDKAIKHWLGAKMTGPFFVIKSLDMIDQHFRCVQSNVDIDVALAFSGNVCVELIKQNCGNPSVYREVLESRGEGFHHWGIMTSNFDEEIARYQHRGYALASNAALPDGTRFAYMDTLAEMPGMVELIESTTASRETFQMVEGAARDWDGNDPVRLLS